MSAEAVGVLTPKIPDALFIQHINHVPLARRLAAQRKSPRQESSRCTRCRELCAGVIALCEVASPLRDELAAWLALEECSFSTGAVFDISGGRAIY